MDLHHILKKNPYHDKAGRFTFASNANYVSLWARELKTFPKQEKREYLDKGVPTPEERQQARELFGQSSSGAIDPSKAVLTADEMEAADRYTSSSSGFNDAAKAMARGVDPSEFDQWWKKDVPLIPALNSAINKSPLPQDRVLWRGLRAGISSGSKVATGLLERVQNSQPIIGSIITTPAFMSTSLSSGTASKFAGGGGVPVMIKINAKKGSKALFTGTVSFYGHEAEMLLPTNSKLLIRNATYRPPSPTSVGSLDIEADLLP